MVRTKIKCDLCGREISKSNFTKHLRSHENGNFDKTVFQIHVDHDDLFCKYCRKEFSNKNSLAQHEIRCKENPNRIKIYVQNGYTKGHIAWNKGLTKETDDRVRKRAETFRKNFLSGKTVIKGHKHTEETKQKISELRKKYLLENPEKHPWKNNKKFISVPCQTFKEKLEQNGLHKGEQWEEEFLVVSGRNFSADVCFPSIKLCIEINGNQHYNKGTLVLSEYYAEREKIIKENGWDVLQVHYLLVYNDEYVCELIEDIKGKLASMV